MVNYPRFVIPLALAFWGWRAEVPLAAGGLVLVVALAAVSPWRWRLDRAQYHRLGDLTSVLFMGTVGYLVVAGGDTPAVYVLLRWLPALLCPLLLAQIYAGDAGVPLSALFYSLRRRLGDRTPPAIDFRLPYAAACLLAAGGGPPDRGGYFPGVAGLLLWCLWCNQPRRRTTPVWLGLFLLAAALGYGGQLGLARLQVLVEQWTLEWFIGRAGDPDPDRVRTAIGDLGRLKQSGRIVLRVAADPPLARPLLLKEAAYDRYLGQSWIAGRAGFSPYQPPSAEASRHLELLRIDAEREVLLAVPAGLRGLFLPADAGNLAANRLGAIKWREAPPVQRFRVAYDPGAPDTTPPTGEDLELVPAIRESLQPLARQLGLAGLPPAGAVAAVAELFARNFAYSLDLGDNPDSLAALRDFLYRRRAGHCEYFATATALLLRAAGVPTRYVAGYSLEEYGAGEGVYLVRSRHAHAWAEAWLDGAWRTLDNTPAAWAEREAQADPWWQGAADLWSRWGAALRVWQWERAQRKDEGGFPDWGWLVLPLSFWLGWRLYRGRQRAPPRRRGPAGAAPDDCADAEYGRLERWLVDAGHPPRRASEPPLTWLRAIGRREFEPEVIAYYRRRYRRRD